jgi:hypothetical protein
MALFAYARLTATLLAESEDRANADKARLHKQIVALEHRLSEFETRLTTIEKWKSEIMEQNNSMQQEFADMMAGGPAKLKEQLVAAIDKANEQMPKATLPLPPKNGETKEDVS